MNEANYHLESLLEYACKNDLQFYYGQAHRFLGELYLNQGEPKLSTPLLIKAVDIFQNLDDFENTEQVKNLAAISAGQELLPSYVNLILNCETNKHKQKNIIKLVKWKDNREPFWEETTDNLSSYCEAGRIGEIVTDDTSELEVAEENSAHEYSGYLNSELIFDEYVMDE